MSRQSQRVTLLSRSLTTAVNSTATDWVGATCSPTALVCEAVFVRGGGGTDATFYLQTSLDGGTTAIDIGCFYFQTTTASKIFTLSALTPVTTIYTPTDGSLTNNTVKDGIIGDCFRLKYATQGTYTTNSSIGIYLLLKGG